MIAKLVELTDVTVVTEPGVNMILRRSPIHLDKMKLDLGRCRLELDEHTGKPYIDDGWNERVYLPEKYDDIKSMKEFQQRLCSEGIDADYDHLPPDPDTANLERAKPQSKGESIDELIAELSIDNVTEEHLTEAQETGLWAVSFRTPSNEPFCIIVRSQYREWAKKHVWQKYGVNPHFATEIITDKTANYLKETKIQDDQKRQVKQSKW